MGPVTRGEERKGGEGIREEGVGREGRRGRA